MDEQEAASPIEVPAESLSPETLTAVIESFILREGTDYGAVEVSLSAKVAQVRRQIEKGDVIIFFDSETEMVGLMNRPLRGGRSVATAR